MKPLFMLLLLSLPCMAGYTISNKCRNDAVVGRNTLGYLYAFAFEPDKCLADERTGAVLLDSQGKTYRGIKLAKRMAGAISIYHLYDADIKPELCPQGSISGKTVNTPIGIMTIALGRNERVAWQNGCVAAVKYRDGMYYNATEISLFMNPFLHAVYAFESNNCEATNVCGLGLVTAEHCIRNCANGDCGGFKNRTGAVLNSKLVKKSQNLDYAIYEQLPGTCVSRSSAVATGETIYITGNGKGGVKYHACEKLQGAMERGDSKCTLRDQSQGNSGAGAFNRRGEYIGVSVAIYHEIQTFGIIGHEHMKK